MRIPGRLYRQPSILFLPGQLGFFPADGRLIFSSAHFLFFNLRQSFVLKRIFATPITRSYLILGELTNRKLLFQVIGFIIMVALGHFAFHFTLVNGVVTFLKCYRFLLPRVTHFHGDRLYHQQPVAG